MNYEPLKIERPLRVGRLYSLHYFQFAAGYIFPGESHDFWEMVYIDRGEADIGAGEEIVRLREGRYNVTQTAEKLGYSSVNAFSRQFRALLGVTPTGYLKSVRK